MIRRLSLLPAALFFFAATTHAQLGPQDFQAPPTLTRTPAPTGLHLTAMAALKSTPAGTPCDPAAEVSHTGNIVTVSLGVEEHENTIYNPGNPASNYRDTVSLRSYGGCLTGPLIDTRPGTTLRVNLTNDLPANDPSCPRAWIPWVNPDASIPSTCTSTACMFRPLATATMCCSTSRRIRSSTMK